MSSREDGGPYVLVEIYLNLINPAVKDNAIFNKCIRKDGVMTSQR